MACIYTVLHHLVLMTTQSALQYYFAHHPFAHTLIQCIYVQHFVYHRPLTHCQHSRFSILPKDTSARQDVGYGDQTTDILIPSPEQQLPRVCIVQAQWGCISHIWPIYYFLMLMFIKCLSFSTIKKGFKPQPSLSANISLFQPRRNHKWHLLW